jgi:hypothetical protein
MSLNTTDITNGVSVSGSTNPFNTYIKTENAGVYNIQFSAQVDKTDGGTDDVVIWLRKNGIDLTDTATTLTLPTNNSKAVAAWNWFVNSAANDYYQIIWYSADTDLRLLAETAGGGHPGIPSVIVTANRVDQFLSNTGSFSGSFTGVFTGSLFGTASYATSASQAISSSFAINASSSLFAVSSSRSVSSSFATLAATATNATTATTANSTVAAATFNNAGSGDASGTTFNGGTARTISYNTIGAQPLLTNPVTGTGVDNQVAVWSGTTTQDSNGNLTFDGTTLIVVGKLENGDSGCVATGSYSHAEGNNTVASGSYSHAEGEDTVALGLASHAEGKGTTATGNWSHAEGSSTQAVGAYSHAEGHLTIASGQYVHTEGSNTIALGNYSHAEGNSTFTGTTTAFRAGDDASISSGVITINSSYGDVTPVFVAGNPIIFSDIDDSNNYGIKVFTIDTVAWDSSNTIVTLTDTSVNTSYANCGDLKVIAAWSSYGGDSTIAPLYAHTEGNATNAFNISSHAEGYQTVAAGAYSHAEGTETISGGANSHAEGRVTLSIGEGSHAEGRLTLTSGNSSHAEGLGAIATGDYSHAEGESTIAIGVASHAAGFSTSASGDYQSVIGMYNQPNTNQGAFIIGNGTGTGARSNLLHASGSQVQITGSLVVTGGITGSISGTTTSASFAISASHADVLDGLTAAAFVLNSQTSSMTVLSSSFAANASSSLRAISSSFATLAASATTATTANSTVAAATFNNAGSGDASGTTFNGGTARTISYNTIGAPSTSGTNATGTWGISITGNALTATSASFATNASSSLFAVSSSRAVSSSFATVAQSVLGTITNANTASNITPAITNTANNRILTDNGGGTINGEADLTFDGTLLKVVGKLENGASGCVATGIESHVEGKSTTAIGDWSHAEGGSTYAVGNGSHAEGGDTYAGGFASHAEGQLSSASGDYSHAEGESTYASGYTSHAEGLSSIAKGDYSHAEGRLTFAGGESSHAAGYFTSASGDYQSVIGIANQPSPNQGAFIIGNGTGPGNKSNLLYASGSNVQITGSLYVSRSDNDQLSAIFATRGSKTNPAYTFIGDEDTGMYRDVANTVGLTAGSQIRLLASDTQLYLNPGTTAFQENILTISNDTIPLVSKTPRGDVNVGSSISSSYIEVTDTTTGTGPYYLMFADGTTGYRATRVDSSTLTFNATTNTLTVANLTGTASSATSASFAINASSSLFAVSSSRSVSSSFATLAATATTAATASTVTVTDTTTGTGPYYLMFADGTTGNRATRVDSSTLTFNATTNTLTVTNLTGTSSFATLATNASNIAVTDTTTTNATHYITFTTGTSGNQILRTDSNTLTFNPSTNIFTVPTVNSTTAVQGGNGSAATPAFSFSGDTNTGMYNVGADTLGFATAGTARMIISSSGNVGIGTTAPSTRLQVVGGSDAWTGLALRDGGSDIPIIDFRVSDNSTRGSIRMNGVNSAGGDRLGLFSWIAGTGLSEVMSIKGGGNVGIGTTNPVDKLDVNGAIRFRVNTPSFTAAPDSGVLDFVPTSIFPTDPQIRLVAVGTSTVGASIAFQTGLNSGSIAEAMRITSGGLVGIGMANPTYKLQVSDTIASVTAFGNFTALQSIGGTGYRWTLANDSTFRLQYTTNGFSSVTTPLFITSNGALGLNVTPTNTAGRFEASNDIVAYSTSDKRWKNNIVKIDSPLEKISQISGVEFDWIEDEPLHGNKGHDVGVIAQEIELVIPEAVQTRESGMKAVQYDKIIPLLIESIKEQQKQIDELKELVNKLTK